MTAGIQECNKGGVIFKIIQQLRFVLDSKDRLKGFFLVLGMFVSGLAELLGLLLIPGLLMLMAYPDELERWIEGKGLSGVLPSGQLEQHLPLYLLLLALFFLGKNVFSSALVHLQTLWQSAAQNKLGRRLMRAYLLAPYEFSLNASSSRRLHLISVQLPRVFNSLISPCLILLSESIVFLILGLSLLLVDARSFVSATFVIGGASVLFYLALRKLMARAGQEQSRLGDDLTRLVNQGLGGLREIKVMGLEERILENFEKISRNYSYVSRLSSSFKLYPKYFIEASVILTITGMIALMLYFGGNNQAEILGGLSFFAVTAIRLAPCLSRIVAAANDILASRSALHEIVEDLATAPPPPEGGSTPLDLRDSIEFRNVHYRYPGSPGETVKQLSFSINKGKTVALVGPSGSGKTTVANLLLGLLSPTDGGIWIDGTAVQVRPESWQKKLGYIPQSVYLADDSIRKNIAFGIASAEVDEQALAEAVRVAQLQDLVADLPLGLEQPVGERGIRLSGGQIQRIGIARALYHRPEILVMDEATSALDNQTEQQITSIIGGLHGKKTLLVIAHRLSTVQNADQVLFLKEGRLHASGSYAGLYDSCPEFRAMVDAGSTLP